MAKLSYVISKSSKRAGKSGFHFDGNGSGNWFQRWFNPSKESNSEVAPEKAEIRDLISKLVSEFDGNSESSKETRVEIEGSAEELKEFAAWSIGEIKANAESLKDCAAFAKDYCQAIGDMSIKIWKGFQEEDHNTESEINELKQRVDDLESAGKKKAKADA